MKKTSKAELRALTLALTSVYLASGQTVKQVEMKRGRVSGGLKSGGLRKKPAGNIASL